MTRFEQLSSAVDAIDLSDTDVSRPCPYAPGTAGAMAWMAARYERGVCDLQQPGDATISTGIGDPMTPYGQTPEPQRVTARAVPIPHGVAVPTRRAVAWHD